jgi:hypothetical protein
MSIFDCTSSAHKQDAARPEQEPSEGLAPLNEICHLLGQSGHRSHRNAHDPNSATLPPEDEADPSKEHGENPTQQSRAQTNARSNTKDRAKYF